MRFESRRAFESPALSALFAAACFAAMGACIRGLSPATSGLSGVFARSLIGLIIALAMHAAQRSPPRVVNRRVMALRVVSGSIALCSYFCALRVIDLGSATLLLYTCPLWVTLLARLVLGEPLSARALIGLPLGLTGAALVLAPDLGLSSAPPLPRLGLALGVLASLSSAVAYVCLRALGRSDDPLSIVTCFSATGALLTAPFAVSDWLTQSQGPPPLDLWLMAGAGLFGAGGQLSLTQAYRRGEASRVAIITLSQVPFAFLLSTLVFDVTASSSTLLGGALVFAGAAFQSRHEPDRGLDGARATKASKPSISPADSAKPEARLD